jgi:hypothetical protein
MNFRSSLAGFVALATLGSCGKDGVDVASVLLVSSVEVTPSTGGLVLGGTAQLTATPKTASGITVPGRTVVWASSNPGEVSVSPTGVITALALGGPVRITATVDGVAGESMITVQPFPVARVTVTPDQAGIIVGGSSELTATAYDAQGVPLPDRFIIWQSSAPAIVAVTSTGIVLGMSEGGPVAISATAEGKADTAFVSVAPRPAIRLSFVQQPGPATAGQPIAPAVRVAIQNDQGGTVSAAANPVSIALSTNPGGATLSGTSTVAAVGGIATFPDLSLDRAAAGYTFIVTSAGLASATSFTFTNVAGPASRLVFTTPPPASAGSGQPLAPQPVLQLQDGSGNAVAQAGIVVTASIASGAATPGGSTTATTNSAGASMFTTLSLSGPGGTITLNFSAPGITAVTSAPITLSAGTTTALAIVTQPSASAQSGVAFGMQPVVKLRDAAGNDVASPGVAITASIASGPAGATLGGGTTVQTSGSGVATFTNLAITGPAGSYTLQFSSPGLAGVTSTAIAVTAASASQLSITTQPSTSATSGKPFAQQPVLQLRDASGNAVGVSGVDVTAAIASGGGTLGGTVTVTTNSSGTASYTDLEITGLPGNRTLSFSSAGLTPAISSTISVGLAPATQLSVSTQPSPSAVSGAPFGIQPGIQLLDALGSPVSQSGVVVTATIASGGGTLGGTTTATTDNSGVATFTYLSISGAPGSRTLGFSAPGLTSATSNTISITAPSASKLTLTTQPSSSAFSGVTFSVTPVIQLEDANGVAVSQSGVPVTVSVASGSAILSGTLTVNTGSTGNASFGGLSLTGPAGDHTLRFTSPGLTEIVSGTIVLGAGPATKLLIVTEPSSTATSGKEFSTQPVIRLLDASDNPVFQSGISITAALNSGIGTLGGHRNRSTNGSGIATYSDLKITGLGDYTIRFTASGLTPVVSATVTVLP